MYIINYAPIPLTNRHFVRIYYGSTVVLKSLRVDSVDPLHFKCDFYVLNCMFDAKDWSVVRIYIIVCKWMLSWLGTFYIQSLLYGNCKLYGHAHRWRLKAIYGLVLNAIWYIRCENLINAMILLSANWANAISVKTLQFNGKSQLFCVLILHIFREFSYLQFYSFGVDMKKTCIFINWHF